MDELRIYAIFKGEDGSLGYKNGKTYELVIKGNQIIKPEKCPYRSVEAFLRNWEPVMDTSNKVFVTVPYTSNSVQQVTIHKLSCGTLRGKDGSVYTKQEARKQIDATRYYSNVQWALCNMCKPNIED